MIFLKAVTLHCGPPYLRVPHLWMQDQLQYTILFKELEHQQILESAVVLGPIPC